VDWLVAAAVSLVDVRDLIVPLLDSARNPAVAIKNRLSIANTIAGIFAIAVEVAFAAIYWDEVRK
jgi:hypothetical protein